MVSILRLVRISILGLGRVLLTEFRAAATSDATPSASEPAAESSTSPEKKPEQKPASQSILSLSRCSTQLSFV